MRRIIALLFILSPTEIFSQPISPAQQAVINAENSFAGLSKSTNTRDAFMAYLSDSTIMFAANKPVAGKTLWIDQKPDSTLLFWWPVFVGVSADGALGFSTGPWEWSKNRETSPEGFGYYATIWQKDKEGNWKMGVDMGISFPETERTNSPLNVSPASILATAQNPTTKQELFTIDNDYNAKLNSLSVSFLANYFTVDGHLLRKGHKPYVKPSDFTSLDEHNVKFAFAFAGGGIAASKDLGYAYGTLKASSTKEDKPIIEERTYLRVWKKENTGWKIVLDVVGSR